MPQAVLYYLFTGYEQIHQQIHWVLLGCYWAAIDVTVRFWHKVAINEYPSQLKADIHTLHKLSELHLEIL